MERYARMHEGSGEAAEAAAKKRRKSAAGESEISTSSATKTRRLDSSTPENEASVANSGDSSCENLNASCSALDSRCSSSGSSELAGGSPVFADLDEYAVADEYFATSAGHSVDFRDRREENSPSNEVPTESGELESTAGLPRAADSRRIPMPEKMVTEAELEEFFTAAEKNIQKQFIEKYNYDIAKDEPLEGRYEWVPV